MTEFFDTLFGYLQALGSYIEGFIRMIGTALYALETLVTLPLFLTGILPSILATAVSLALLLWLVKFFLGR